MGANMPFPQEDMNEIFKISLIDPERVSSRENSTLEFKESFGWMSLSKYMKTSAAYANTKGGYIVFGISNDPRRLCGLSETSSKLFNDIDPERLSRSFNEHFSPELEWSIQEYELYGKIFGLLYIHEAKDKPVVCTKDAGKELKEGDIYYRYRGRSERIKYSELRAILEAKRETEQRLWMQHLTRIARIGVRETGVFDLTTGSVTGVGGTFLIDESLLSQLAFIKEGEFSEVKGKPALKLIGNVESLVGGALGTTKKQIIRTRGIRTADIVLNSLNQVDVPEPNEYIKQICSETTAYLPVYYFIKKAKISINSTISMVEGLVVRSSSKTKLLSRLRNKETLANHIPRATTENATKKRAYADMVRNKTVDQSIEEAELKYCLQAIRGLTEDEIKLNSKYIRELLREWFNKHYTTPKAALADNLRRTICWVDEALHMGDCK